MQRALSPWTFPPSPLDLRLLKTETPSSSVLFPQACKPWPALPSGHVLSLAAHVPTPAVSSTRWTLCLYLFTLLPEGRLLQAPLSSLTEAPLCLGHLPCTHSFRRIATELCLPARRWVKELFCLYRTLPVMITFYELPLHVQDVDVAHSAFLVPQKSGALKSDQRTWDRLEELLQPAMKKPSELAHLPQIANLSINRNTSVHQIWCIDQTSPLWLWQKLDQLRAHIHLVSS